MDGRPQADGMGKEDRKEQVLRILVESGFALPPVVIFRNAKLGGATFERRSVNNYLNELVEEGRVIRVDSEALDDGKIIEVDTSTSGYFMATEKGADSLKD